MVHKSLVAIPYYTCFYQVFFILKKGFLVKIQTPSGERYTKRF